MITMLLIVLLTRCTNWQKTVIWSLGDSLDINYIYWWRCTCKLGWFDAGVSCLSSVPIWDPWWGPASTCTREHATQVVKNRISEWLIFRFFMCWTFQTLDYTLQCIHWEWLFIVIWFYESSVTDSQTIQGGPTSSPMAAGIGSQWT